MVKCFYRLTTFIIYFQLTTRWRLCLAHPQRGRFVDKLWFKFTCRLLWFRFM